MVAKIKDLKQDVSKKESDIANLEMEVKALRKGQEDTSSSLDSQKEELLQARIQLQKT